MIALHPVTSSNIAAVGYDPGTMALYVKFRTGSVHVYSGVPPEKYQAFLAAPSIGQYFHALIRDKYAQKKLEPT